MLRFFDFLNACGQGRGAIRVGCLLLVGGVGLLVGCRGPQAVTTYKNDNNRTGWNEYETTLTISNVSSSNFGLLPYSPIAVDDQVDTQPLVVPRLKVVKGTNIGNDDVVYVTTENNSVYAIDGNTGAQLAMVNLGTPVPVLMLTMCNNNGNNVGINGTPVIDLPSKTMYVIAYTMINGSPTYYIHALDITTLADKVPAVPINPTYSGAGGPVSFLASAQRQRAGLLAANGNVYAAFGSFCDGPRHQSRGWIVGWKQQTLAPLNAIVTDAQAQASSGLYLSSIWMSGSGLAEGNDGNIYAVTGNSSGPYNNGSTSGAPPGYNLSESVIKVAPDLSVVKDWFTPPNASTLDANDWDFGSGGVMLLPGQYPSLSGGNVQLATAAGKFGTMYVLNANNLGGNPPPSTPAPQPLAQPNIGFCWCNQSYFYGASGQTIVSSGGGNGQPPPANPYVPATVQLWSIPSGSIGATVNLVNGGQSQNISPQNSTIQSGGFFTSVSGFSGKAIIWAVARPDTNSNMTLYAFSQAISLNGTLTQLGMWPKAGYWPSQGGIWLANANTVPVVANGRVYVASYKQLSVFGLLP